MDIPKNFTPKRSRSYMLWVGMKKTNNTLERQHLEMGSYSQPTDFVYFNHAQHVQVGQIECQTCHGPVEEMEIMYQYSPLTMGWCVNCHRETNVKVESNEYYAKIHEALSKKYGVES